MSDVSSVDPADVGLRFSSDERPGITRGRHGKGFSYRTASGDRVAPAEVDRIKALAIPPAWTDVWICPSPKGHLQATGRDARGRKQYRYHATWRAVAEETKFAELSTFGAALPDLRKKMASDLARPGLSEDKAVALVLTLLDRTLIRVGNEEYRRTNGTYGLTTMLRRHVQIDGSTMRFAFIGKGGLRHDVKLSDRRLAALVRRCHELGGRALFSYLDDEGEVTPVDSGDANDYLREVVGGTTSVKTFRTWGGTSAVLDHLAAVGPDDTPERQVLEAFDQAATRLGNTRTVVRQSYVHPRVPESYLEGELPDLWARSRSTAEMSRAERAVLRVLAE
jgi:DNA topoisomerase-1